MKITYFGHSSFRLKNSDGIVITDPFDESVGFPMPKVSADIVTVSHSHSDHNNYSVLRGTVRRDDPFIITHSGEYEVGGISVFGVQSFHDQKSGAKRGKNNIFTVLQDEIRVCHLGDLGHVIDSKLVEKIGLVDVLLVPVGGIYTIGPEEAVKVIRKIEPSIVIPMHYKTQHHDQEKFGRLKTVQEFMKVYGSETDPQEELRVTKSKLPEETMLVVLK